MKLQEIADTCHEISVEHEWWSDDDLRRARNLDPELIATKLMLIVSEAAEGLEAIRRSSADAVRDDLTEELADVVIRAFDLAGAMGVGIEEAIRFKIAKNRGRPIRHGGLRL